MENEFATKYTNANIAQDATQYDSELFLQQHAKLAELLPCEGLASALIAVILCSQGRGDTVVRLFSDITEGKSKSAVRETFTIVREGLSIAVPFVGLPNCMPACFGLINKLQALGVEDVTAPRRENIREFDFTTRGQETTATLYRGVGNPEVRQMIQQYFPEISYFGRTTIWGYLVGSSPILELKDAEILVAGAIAGLGATRQARSHVKCSLSVGNSVETVAAMIESVKVIASWNKRPLSGTIDVGQLADDLQQNLAQLN